LNRDSGSPPVAVVTGGGSGIGRAVARRLLDAGFAVVVGGRRRAPLEETVAGLPGPSLAVEADVTDELEVVELFAAAAAAFGRVDLLFNNAGEFGASAPIEDCRLDDWERTIRVNLTGAFLCARQAVRAMSAQSPQGGRIINNGSVSAQVPRPNAIAYTASKHAITGLTRSIALEGRGRRISCGQIDVGNARTELSDAVAAGALQADGSVESEPTMAVDHVAEAALYMASLPADANVLSLTVMANGMPLVGRG
jgi:NAD(P)-dependent dehydrogenase (short-subunit alcohol dehydrogenase family)